MKKFVSGLFGICFVVLGFLCIFKFFDLLTTPVHVGIDVDFFGMEVKKNVPEGYIMNYAMGFLGFGGISLILGGLLFKTGFIQKNNKHSIIER